MTDAPKPKPPRPAMFEKVGGPISQPESDYVVYMAMKARKAGLKDELNDFEEDEERPIEIHGVWANLGYPTSFKAFQTAQKGKARAISPAPPKSMEPSLNVPSTSADQLTGVLSAKFGLPQAALDAFSTKAVARAQRSSNLPKDSSAGGKYKPLKGVVKEEVSALIDQALASLLQLSEKHGTDPTVATKLFQKKLDYFSRSLWDMWEMQCALKRVSASANNERDGKGKGNGEGKGKGKGEGEGEGKGNRDSNGEEEEEEEAAESDKDGLPSMSISQNKFYNNNLSYFTYNNNRGFWE